MDAATLDALGVAGAVPCRDPECAGVAEPEQDGQTGFLACTECGHEFGYYKIETTPVPVDAQGSCAIGVPESIRRAFPGPKSVSAPVSLGLSIPVRSSL